MIGPKKMPVFVLIHPNPPQKKQNKTGHSKTPWDFAETDFFSLPETEKPDVNVSGSSFITARKASLRPSVDITQENEM